MERMAGKDVVRNFDISRRLVLNDCSLCIEGTTKNTPMPFRIHVVAGPGEVIHINVAALN